jgi:GNAT superfamily N-acetyltransferase
MTGAVAIEPVRDDAAIAAASDLARDFFAYMRTAFPEKAAAIDTYLVIQDFEGQLATFRDHFNPPHGECMLARLDGAPVGVVMLKPYDIPGVCELNRMYVVRAARGLGIGRGLCERLIGRARELGYPRDPPRRAERPGRSVAALPEPRLRPRPGPARLRPRRARRHLPAHAPLT